MSSNIFIKPKLDECVSKLFVSKERVVVLLRGAPGSGKSSLARFLVEEYGGEIVSADNYFIQPDGVYCFDPSELYNAHSYCFNWVDQILSCHPDVSNIIVDNTNIKISEMVLYAKLASEYSVYLHVLHSYTPWKFNVQVLHKKTLHNVPVSTIERMVHTLRNDEIDAAALFREINVKGKICDSEILMNDIKRNGVLSSLNSNTECVNKSDCRTDRPNAWFHHCHPPGRQPSASTPVRSPVSADCHSHSAVCTHDTVTVSGDYSLCVPHTPAITTTEVCVQPPEEDVDECVRATIESMVDSLQEVFPALKRNRLEEQLRASEFSVDEAISSLLLVQEQLCISDRRISSDTQQTTEMSTSAKSTQNVQSICVKPDDSGDCNLVPLVLSTDFIYQVSPFLTAPEIGKLSVSQRTVMVPHGIVTKLGEIWAEKNSQHYLDYASDIITNIPQSPPHHTLTYSEVTADTSRMLNENDEIIARCLQNPEEMDLRIAKKLTYRETLELPEYYLVTSYHKQKLLGSQSLTRQYVESEIEKLRALEMLKESALTSGYGDLAGVDNQRSQVALRTQIDAVRCVLMDIRSHISILQCVLTPFELDLHGLDVHCALERVADYFSIHQMRLQAWLESNQGAAQNESLTLITGRGLHSVTHRRPPIKYAVIRWLSVNEYEFQDNVINDGVIIVKLSLR